MRRIRDVASDESGATVVEYGLILALIFLAMVTAVVGFANGTIELWNYVADQVASG
jgi:pilus assembly protein Flp/PilA